MATLSLYIADVDDNFVTNVLAAVARTPSVRVVGYAQDGCTALREIQSLRPNIVLTDIQLPGLDGINLIRQVTGMRRPPLCIACTRFYADVALDAARHFGAGWFIYKPIDFARLPGIITGCWEARCRCAPEKPRAHTAGERYVNVAHLRDVLINLGFPVRRNGSLYLVEALLRIQSDPHLMKNLSKGLYAELASILQTTPSGVERSLRSAIACAYERGALSEAFPARPSNRAFIEYLRHQLAEDEDSFPPGV